MDTEEKKNDKWICMERVNVSTSERITSDDGSDTVDLLDYPGTVRMHH